MAFPARNKEPAISGGRRADFEPVNRAIAPHRLHSEIDHSRLAAA
jgi:hypothetical protein